MRLAGTHKVSLYKLVVVSNKESYSLTPAYTGLDVNIYPASADILAVYPGQPSYQLYEMYVSEPCTIANGDKVISSSGEEWIVRGVPQSYETMNMWYQRCVVEKVV